MSRIIAVSRRNHRYTVSPSGRGGLGVNQTQLDSADYHGRTQSRHVRTVRPSQSHSRLLQVENAAPSPIATLSSSSLEFPSPRLLINLLDSAGKSLGLQAWHAHFIVRPLISSVRLASTTDMIDRIEVYLCSSVHIHFTITIIPYLNEGLLSRL